MMRIKEAAKVLGVSPDTLRRFEKRELIKCKRDWAGNRYFEDEDLEKIRGIIYPKEKA